jgi:hypothetical protein
LRHETALHLPEDTPVIYAFMDLPVFRLQFALEHPWMTVVGTLGIIAVYAALYPRTTR